jgi:hypothetical protein
MHNNSIVSLTSVLVLFVMIVLGCTSGRQSNDSTNAVKPKDPKEEVKARFESLKDDYAKLPATVRLTSAPYIKGKIVYLWNRSLPGGGEEISINTGYLDDNSKLSSIYAKSPDEVQTVVFQICKRVDSGKVYVDPLKPEIAQKPLPALIWKCEITLVDRTIPAVIHKREIQSKLPQTITVRDTQKEGGGPPPWSEVADFLLSLPRS